MSTLEVQYLQREGGVALAYKHAPAKDAATPTLMYQPGYLSTMEIHKVA